MSTSGLSCWDVLGTRRATNPEFLRDRLVPRGDGTYVSSKGDFTVSFAFSSEDSDCPAWAKAALAPCEDEAYHRQSWANIKRRYDIEQARDYLRHWPDGAWPAFLDKIFPGTMTVPDSDCARYDLACGYLSEWPTPASQ